MAGKRENSTIAERRSDREMAVTRSFAAPASVVFEAWSKAELFRQWWLPPSFGMTMRSCEMDCRTGGSYRLVISHPDFDEPMAFFGRYLEVVPCERIVWTNDENPDSAITTVTFEERDGRTIVTVSDLFPSKEALDAEIENGATAALPEQLAQLDSFLSGGD